MSSHRVLPSPSEFARFELRPDLFESVCLHCLKVLGTSSKLRGLTILEGAHRCTKAAGGNSDMTHAA